MYGKPFTGAESMTAFHRPWSYTPRRLKHIADLELALGVTRFCIHTSPHQPTQVPPPGIGLAPFLGQAFIRTEPWAELAGPWIDYLARCSWLLNQGVPAVDVAVFIGEEAPVTALYGEEPDRSVPAGFDFDYVDLDALEQRIRVADGDLVAGETRYRRAVPRRQQLADDGARAAPPGRAGGRRRDGRRPASGRLAVARGRRRRARPALRPALERRLVVDTDDLGSALERAGAAALRSSSRAPSCCGSAGASAGTR